MNQLAYTVAEHVRVAYAQMLIDFVAADAPGDTPVPSMTEWLDTPEGTAALVNATKEVTA